MPSETGLLEQAKDSGAGPLKPTLDRPAAWKGLLTEYGKDAPIAIFTALAIFADLLLRFVWRAGYLDLVPLYLALLAGGIPLLAGLLRQAFNACA